MGMATLGTPADESTEQCSDWPHRFQYGHGRLPNVDEYRSIYAISPVFTVVGGEHSILPPRNVRGEVDENTLALTLSWDQPGGYEEVDLRYNIWSEERRRVGDGQNQARRGWTSEVFDVARTRNNGYDIDHEGSLSATTFEHDDVTYTVTGSFQRQAEDTTLASDAPDSNAPVDAVSRTLTLSQQLILTFENGDSVALADATKSDVAADTVNDVPAHSIFRWADEGISFQSGLPVLFNFYDGEGNALIDSLTGVVVDGTTWTDDRSDRRYGVQAIDAEGRTSPRVDYVCSERTGCVIPGG